MQRVPATDRKRYSSRPCPDLCRLPPHSQPLQRSREDDNDGEDHNVEMSDDDVSLVSRSPSPVQGAMDVDGISKYDEFVRGEPQEVITIETRIKSSNKGFAMLAKLGWSEGQPLGLSGDGAHAVI